MGLEFKEPFKGELGYTREAGVIKFNGKEVAKEEEGRFVLDGYVCEVTSQSASKKIDFKKLFKAEGVEKEEFDREAYLAKAKELGLEFPSNIKSTKLKEIVDEALKSFPEKEEV